MKLELTGKRILITGGTGSFGNAVFHTILDSDIDAEIRIFSRDEKKQNDMRISYNDSRLKFYVGDVRDPNSFGQVFSKVDYVFHAAALKQVPSCEFFPMEATKTNILGANNVVKAAVENGVKTLVCLSTDKAAYPINAMGMSKALMEKTALSYARQQSDTRICVTRYGNVMGSRGSVIPLFRRQLDTSGEITVTDPDMTRFLMTLKEAVKLVLYAWQNGNSGDTFVQKSPAATIADLAEAVSQYTNKEIGKINIIGTRHGEKKHETLLTSEERAKAVDLGEYFRVPLDGRDLNYKAYFSEGSGYSKMESYHSGNTEQISGKKIVQKLEEMDELEEVQ